MMLLSAPAAVAQKAVAKLDTAQIRIGEQIHLTFQVSFPKNAKTSWVFSDTLSKSIEVLNRSKIDTSKRASAEGLTDYTQTLTITSFDSGVHVIPAFEFSYLKPKDATVYKLYTDSLTLKVLSVPVDTTANIRDIKAPMKQPLTFREILPYLLIGIGVCLIGALVWYIWWRRRNNKPLISFEHKPKLPAWQEALNSLQETSNKKLPASGKLKQYYTEITDALRVYLSKQHDVAAIEMTSDEILEAFDTLNLSQAAREKLSQVLYLADLVKFAKEQPLDDENARSMTNATGFVMDTKPAETHEPLKTETS